MTFQDLKQQALREYYPALALENILPRRQGRRMLKVLRFIWGSFLIAGVLSAGFAEVNPDVAVYVPKIFGLMLIFFSAWIAAASLDVFYNSYYYKSLPEGKNPKPAMPFELARVLYQTRGDDALLGFAYSDEGSIAMMRSGISAEDFENFLEARKQIVKCDALSFADGEQASFRDYADALYQADKDFAQFLFSHSIQKKDFLAIVGWVLEREIAVRQKDRWWSRSSLGRIPGIGKNWSYGQIFNLEKYARALPYVSGRLYETHGTYGSKELEELESVLVRDRSANALVVGDDNAGNLELVARIGKMIDDGTAMPELEHKRLVMLDTDLLTSSAKTKTELEALIISILQESHGAGNIILVFADFPSFIHSAEALGVDAVSILNPYISASSLQIIGLSDIERFHSAIERNTVLMEEFETILVENIDETNTVRVLENEIIPLERHHKIIFTYPALVAIAESAERYFPDAIMPDKAIDLLLEIVPKIASQKKRIVRKEDVLSLVTTKTGIPVGDITEGERDKLLNLESILHHRIIGQDEAVTAIANAVRRARSGINNPNRPTASFLFLGPTGVGKTETTKALGEVFFGKDTHILRLDMSEYSSRDALEKLTGSFEGGKPGVLSSMLREHPYGVLLLDEFEKTTPEVMNLFLQVLDEGFFSDMSGKRVNARNLLIIATSNAGSDLIWEAIKHGESLDKAKDAIIDSLVKSHIFKPELLNRFDGVIIFHPLGNEHLEKIARLQLEKLKVRLSERGINLAVSDYLVKYVMQYGTDSKFGARPMNRAIQDKVEQAIAEKMIRGSIKLGAEVVLSVGDLRS